MRRKHVLFLFTSIALTFLILTRHHLQNLAEVATTFATFYPYVGQHPETLYQYLHENTSQARAHLVPRIIHQIFLTEGVHAPFNKYESAISSCRALHPDWTHYVWINENASAFMEEHYPHVWPHYQSYKQSIQRANILRYALLDHFGGVYLDLDITCLQPLDELRHLPWLTPGAYPAGVNNAFILSKPHHAFTKHLLDGVASRNLRWGMPYIENMLSTGCMYFSNRWMSYMRMLPKRMLKGEVVNDDDKLYILADERGELEPHMLRGAVTTPLFHHGGASSWHGWDAATIVLIGKHYLAFLLIMSFGLLLTAAVICKVLLRWQAQRQVYCRSSGEICIVDDEEESIGGVKEG